MQTLMLIALGLISGTAVIAGALGLALHPPAILRKPLLSEPLDRPDHALKDAVMYNGTEGSSGDSHS
ncbi:hypothetical protein JNB91_22715 [Rhizobium wenxiniae]|uniref:hypothetical protein n=1 Tax=Rhizobium wenxiniae TaxID=1737357 RepID=UPI001C6E920D|nr:hypothetical protein [Rhizobium wenxiniae]MBW9090632.1 hypothetical protein [Rhizobium wenxiniae]